MQSNRHVAPEYLSGFGNEHETEAIEGALPRGQFSPQRHPLGLYTEQLSGTAFTAPRASNRRTWMYRLRPSVLHGRPERMDKGLLRTAPCAEMPVPAVPLRWDPVTAPGDAVDFVDGLQTWGTCGSASMQAGIAVHLYAADAPMTGRFFANNDGEMLIVPESGRLRIASECGVLEAAPGDIAVVPRGIKWRVELPDERARGYVCENYGQPFSLPERGPVGSNGFANTRDFLYPRAAFEDREGEFELVIKFGGELHRAELGFSPLDVVAWTGNHAPYKYPLDRFNVIGTVSYDHPDPSIFTVLTSPSAAPGVANVDFVIFPPRWMVAEHTFRPPWFHRNVMSEFMGLVHGQYDAKKTGFVPGGASLHNALVPHGPEAQVFERASTMALEPEKYENTLAFMFETRYVIAPTRHALEHPGMQNDYADCWKALARHFEG